MAVFDPKRMKAKLSQGVTTVVVGNCGISASPSPLARHSTLIPPLDLLGDNSSFRFTNANDYMEALAAAAPTVNVLPLVGHTVLRARAMDDLQLPASNSQLAAMQKDLSTALAAGMNGFSTGLAYPPAKAASTDEVLALAEVVADVDGLWTTHMRDERSGVVAAVAETIDIARRSGVRTLISHHKCCGEAGIWAFPHYFGNDFQSTR
jgi:N-acyl-D-amino-acid deacylase